MASEDIKKLLNLMEGFQDGAARQDYVDYQHGELAQADRERDQADQFAAQGTSNTALSPEQQARRQALAAAKTADANKRSSMAANPDFNRNSPNAEPWAHAKQASTARNQVTQLTQQIRQAPRPQLPRESKIYKIYRNGDGSATVVLESGAAYWYNAEAVQNLVNESGRIDRNKLTE